MTRRSVLVSLAQVIVAWAWLPTATISGNPVSSAKHPAASGADFRVPAPENFKPYVNKSGVQVGIYRVGEGTPWIRASTQIPATVAQVYGVLKDFQGYKKLFRDDVDSVRVLQRFADGARLHIVWPLPFPMSDRDAVVRYWAIERKDGSREIRWHHAGRPGDPEPDGVRIEKVVGQTRMVSSGRKGEASHMVFTYLGDLGGSLPEFIEEAAWKGEPFAYFNHVRKALGLPQVDVP